MWCETFNGTLPEGRAGVSTNTAASVRARLLNISRREGRDYNRLLLLFVQERLLARLSISSHADHFVLKGGLFLYSRWGTAARPTRDLDLLGRGFPSEIKQVVTVLREIVSLELNDGVRFDSEQVSGARIKEGAEYEGVRVNLSASIGSARIPVQVDVGFGDTLTPAPQTLEFPTLLEFPDLPAPRVMAYSMETVLAEKFQAMVYLGTSNSRAKDFFDVMHSSRHDSLETLGLREAIRRTFLKRETPLEDAKAFLKSDVANHPDLRAAWQRFRANNPSLDTPADFLVVFDAIREFLEPIVDGRAVGRWSPGLRIWSEKPV